MYIEYSIYRTYSWEQGRRHVHHQSSQVIAGRVRAWCLLQPAAKAASKLQRSFGWLQTWKRPTSGAGPGRGPGGLYMGAWPIYGLYMGAWQGSRAAGYRVPDP